MTAPTADPARLARARARLAASGVEVLLEDHLLLGIAKAAGVLSQRGPQGETSLVERIDEYRREAEGKPGRAFVGMVHRLDRNVSGAMVVAKSSKAASRLSAAFRAREGSPSAAPSPSAPLVEKTYLAWVAGTPAHDAARLTDALVRDRDDGRRVTRVAAPAEAADEDAPPSSPASLSYEVVARGDGCARLLVRLHTGVTHQIRAQLSAAGLPLFSDEKYGGPRAPPAAGCDRPALHAWRLVVPHPVGGAPVAIEAPVPDDLRRLDAALALSPPVAGRPG